MDFNNLITDKILVYGNGHIGQSFFVGVSNHKLVKLGNIQVVGRPLWENLAFNYNYGAITPEAADVIVIAVKPNDCLTVAQELRKKLRHDQLLISFAAFHSLERIKIMFGHDQTVRVMPTLALETAKSDSRWLGSTDLMEGHKMILYHLFGNLGKLTPAKDDKEIDQHTLLASCNIGVLAWLLCRYMASWHGVYSDVDFAVIKEVVLYNTSALIDMVTRSEKWNLHSLSEAVQTPGGITERIVSTLEEYKVEQGLFLSAEAGVDFIAEFYHKEQTGCGGC